MCCLLPQSLRDQEDRFLALSSISEAVGKICPVARRNLPKLCVGYSESLRLQQASHGSAGDWLFLRR